ncbi:IS3 family transposase [Streptomyces pratens]|uniref:IS3 family transposase n=1 Tax=Streptomyces pratens TaxID=887456 RepID=UPI00360A70E5
MRRAEEDELAGEIREIHAGSRGAYGAPRVTAALRRKGRRINRKKVERIMRERDIRGITLPPCPPTGRRGPASAAV